MKNLDRKIAFLIFLVALSTNVAFSQEATGLPGDHFSLEGALEVFQKSKDLAAFEKSLNKSDNKVNNLDLNEDGDIDYIQVTDHVVGDAHAIVLQVAVNKLETQDVAVIEIEKDGANSAILQIIGDEDIYGEQMIVEPYDIQGSGGQGGPDANYDLLRVTVNVWMWSPVRAIYAPRYVAYTSPWRWAYYPNWWKPRRALVWNVWRPYRYYFPSRYRIATTHRVVVAHRIYTPIRTRSVVVKTRTTKVLASNGNRTVVRNNSNTKGIATNGKKAVAVNKNTGTYAATNGTSKVIGNKNTGKLAMTNGEAKMIANKQSGKVAMTNGNKKVVANKSTGKVAATNGKTTKVSSRKSTKKKVSTKAKKANRKNKKVVKRG